MQIADHPMAARPDHRPELPGGLFLLAVTCPDIFVGHTKVGAVDKFQRH